MVNCHLPIKKRANIVFDRRKERPGGTTKQSASRGARPVRARRRTADARELGMGGLGGLGAGRLRGGVQSIGRGFAILEEIARNRDGIGLAELSKRVGLHNSTTFHLVKTMVSLGYVRQLEDSKRYRVGRPLFALAASALDEIEMISLATPVLEDLSRETGEAAHFSVRMGDAVVVLARTGGQGAFQLTDRVGVVRPAHCTALGKIMLAALSAEQFERYLRARGTQAADGEIDHVALTRCGARSPRCGARGWPSTTANSTANCAAWRCRCAIFPGR